MLPDTQPKDGPADSWLKRELIKGMGMFLYLWAQLALFVLNETIVNRQHGASFAFQGYALINALALTKVMLTADQITLSRHLVAYPRICTIVFDAALCTVLFLIAHVVERVVAGLFKGEALSASMPSFGGGGIFGVVSVGLIFFVSLLPFFTYKSLALALGPKRVRATLLRSRLSQADVPEE